MIIRVSCIFLYGYKYDNLNHNQILGWIFKIIWDFQYDTVLSSVEHEMPAEFVKIIFQFMRQHARCLYLLSYTPLKHYIRDAKDRRRNM